ncbi:MAG: phosphonate metabolism protein [Devosia sp.]|uniref:alpha-D-ribose 1-methylphosphonate 5-triphosphate diphosphatase n=1 Tax=Devosia sp. TaxID=1871048 RepID=UPI002608B181|nr:alpha-D-ribose 1-methylphosphonate 5-triphosphate diphosphatase [Devosia sp.]MDB5528224.1 phosphonate metabolism protein [Devosia sp.]
MSQILSNARIVLADRTITGSVTVDNGMIAAVSEGADMASDALDFGGDYLLPGIIDLHTDNLEHHMQPRPAVRWPSSMAAALAHDWQVLGAGVTTVLDSLSMGDYDSKGQRTAMLEAAIAAVGQAKAAGVLKSDHYLHFRYELSDAGLLDLAKRHVDNPAVRLVSMMDHTPGQGQWHDLTIYRAFRKKKNGQVWTEPEWDLYIAERVASQAEHVGPARAWVSEAAKAHNIPMASHDDTTVEDVDRAHGYGIGISEFPTTMAAAKRAHELGMQNVMGAPNVVLGGSHSGNVSALALADEGLLDILTSDYVPASMLQAAFILANRGLAMHDAVAMVSARPAAALGFADRGRIETGLRADLLRVRVVDGLPVIDGIWVAGRKFM